MIVGKTGESESTENQLLSERGLEKGVGMSKVGASRRIMHLPEEAEGVSLEDPLPPLPSFPTAHDEAVASL